MNLQKADGTLAKLKANLIDPYWGHIYCLPGDCSQDPLDYEVYVEYHGEFDSNRLGELVNLLGDMIYTLAIPTRQIIIG